ncbi:hypothetical protein MRX96_022394 [Rhipicephalus microplus]
MFNTFKRSAEECDDYSVIVKKFQEYCSFKRNETYECYIFGTPQQRDGEPFEQVLRDVHLKPQSSTFGNLKESMVRDRVVCRMADKKLRTRLLREKELTLDKAIEHCKAAKPATSQIQAWEKDEANLKTAQKSNLCK